MPPSQALEAFAAPATLAGSIDYQSGSVVSQALIQKAQGSLTLFAFDQGQGLSEHTAPFDAFVTILEGEAELTAGGKKHRVQAGESLWFPAGQPHAVDSVTAFKMLLVMIRG